MTWRQPRGAVSLLPGRFAVSLCRTRRLVEMRRMPAGSPFGKLTTPLHSGYNQLLVLTYEENISTKEKAQDARARLSVADAEQEREEGAETADVQGPRAPDCVAARDATA